MTHAGLRAALVLTLCHFAAPLSAQESRAVDVDRAALAAEIEKARADGGAPAVQIAIARDGRVIFEAGFGLADVENEVPATKATRFRTASIAKSMTALGVMKLAEEGKLDLDADVRSFSPEFPEKPFVVTPRLLLGHLGGVRHYAKPGESSGTRRFATLASSVALFGGDPLVAEPATKYVYTTFGYTLLGRAIETASGTSFAEHLDRAVFAPAGMTSTCVDTSDVLVPKRAAGYRRTAPKDGTPAVLLNADLHDTSMKIPGGGYRSTASDLVRMAAALMDGKIVSDATRDAMWTRQRLKDGTETEYGLGFGLARGKDGGPVVSHSGAQAGATCLLVIRPDRRLAYAVMTNLEDAPVRRIADLIAARL